MEGWKPNTGNWKWNTKLDLYSIDNKSTDVKFIIISSLSGSSVQDVHCRKLFNDK